MSRSRNRKNVFVLAICQMLFGSGRTMLIMTSPLIALVIAPYPALATLPVAFVIIGTALATLPASLLMRRVGRRLGFVSGALLGAAGGAACLGGLVSSNFLLFCLGAMLYGAFSGFAQLYRFAATDVAPDDFKGKAISLVLAGGVAAALLGPELAKLGRDLFTSIEFVGVYAIVIGLSVLSALVVMGIDIPNLTQPRRATRDGLFGRSCARPSSSSPRSAP